MIADRRAISDRTNRGADVGAMTRTERKSEGSRPVAGRRPLHACVTVAAWTYPGDTVSQMRLNQLTGRWVTIVADRADRPTDFAPRGRQIEADTNRPCPFCPGNEESTPPALEAVDEAGSWSIRIVPNLYPAFDGDDGFAVRHLGPVHVAAKASGIHEIFVFSPDHDGGLHDLDDRQATALMHALKRRFVDHAEHPPRSLHAGDRQPWARGGRLAVAPARTAPRSAVRAGRGARRGAGVRPLRRRLRVVHHGRGRDLGR